jgi:3'(2'), 5'-bisphosphate nucleotidase
MIDKIDTKEVVAIARQAGEAVMQIYGRDFKVDFKEDNSPLTEADLKSNEIICDALTRLYPSIPILSEENKTVAYKERKKWEYYWCVDPIDGTKEFIKKNGEFTVNIALVFKDTPVLGVVYAPALDAIYYAKKGEGAYKNGQKLPLHVNADPKERMTVVASKSHLSNETQDFIDTLDTKKVHTISKGSSLKLCMVAEGAADIYPRLGPTMEWDTAAADAIVRQSGKMAYQFGSSKALVYNKKDLLNPWFVVK